MKALVVSCEWDPEAGVWYVADSDVPGLVCEADTIELMEQKLRTRIPELLVLNTDRTHRNSAVPWELIARKQDSIAFAC
jgi:hypothetical protein